MITGFVIGKFFPFHLGHMYLLDVARAHSDHLIVWVCEKAQQEIPGHIRVQWIQELYPGVEVRLVPDTLDDTDTAGWAAYTLRVLGKAPDIVFSSEDYGEPYAHLMGAQHHLVDKERAGVPISGTQVRLNTSLQYEYLAPPVRAYFAKKIVVLGAESTGTTTLARDLAEALHTVWVPEYGRTYSEKRARSGEGSWHTHEFIHIAAEQQRREEEAARHADTYLVCDTDAFATLLWHKRYMGHISSYVERIFTTSRKAELYILTGDEIPFVQDGLRDGEHIRHAMHQWFLDELQKRCLPYIVVSGTKEERLKHALREIHARK